LKAEVNEESFQQWHESGDASILSARRTQLYGQELHNVNNIGYWEQPRQQQRKRTACRLHRVSKNVPPFISRISQP